MMTPAQLYQTGGTHGQPMHGNWEQCCHFAQTQYNCVEGFDRDMIVHRQSMQGMQQIYAAVDMTGMPS